MANDKVSYARALAIKGLFPHDKINKNSSVVLDTVSTNISDINKVLHLYGINKIQY